MEESNARVKIICQLPISDDRFIAVAPLIHPKIISILNLTLHNISIIIIQILQQYLLTHNYMA